MEAVRLGKVSAVVAAIAATMFLLAGVVQAQELLFSDNFNVSATSNNINFENSQRQSGSVGVLNYSEKDRTATGGDNDSRTSVDATAPGFLNITTGFMYDPTDDEFLWASPNHDFIAPGKIVISYKVKPGAGNGSCILFGSSYQGTYYGYSRAYWTGEGTAFWLNVNGGWTLERMLRAPLTGTVATHSGFYDVKILMDNNGADTTLNIWVDGVKILDNYLRTNVWEVGYGYTNNYISLMAYSNDLTANNAYDDLYVTKIPQAPEELRFSDNFNLNPDFTPERVLRFSDDFDVSATSNNVNFENNLRQSGNVGVLNYSENIRTASGGDQDSRTSVVATSPGYLNIITGYYYDPNDQELVWVSPNYNFIASGLTEIKYKVTPGAGNGSCVLFGSSYQGTYYGYTRVYYEGNGNAFWLNVNGDWSLERYLQAPLTGTVATHSGFYDIRILMDNNGANSKLSIWVDDTPVVLNMSRGGWTYNYISLMGYSYDLTANHAYDDLSVTQITTTTNDINQQNCVRQNGSVGVLNYSENIRTATGGDNDFRTSVDATTPGFLNIITGYYYDPNDQELVWVSPNYNFIASGLTEIEYKVRPGAGNGSCVLFGSSYQGTYYGYTRVYWEGNGNAFWLNVNGGWTLERYQQAPLTGTVATHDGFYDVRILKDNNVANSTLNIWVDGVQVINNMSCAAWTYNYISLMGYSYDLTANHAYDDFSVSGFYPGARETSLDGAWRYLPAANNTDPPPPIDGSWGNITIPGTWGDGGTHDNTWFGCTFIVNASDLGRKSFLINFGSVAFRAKVYLNGTLIGTHIGDWSPFELDATSAIKAGQNVLQVMATNSRLPRDYTVEIMFGALDWLYSGGFGDIPDSYPRWQMGIPQPVTLKVLPESSYINSVFVKPLVSTSTLTADIELKNDSGSAVQGVKVSGEVLDATGTPVLQLSEVLANIPAQGTTTAVLSETWTSGQLWWPDNPYLYTIQIYLKDPAGNLIQTKTDRFGWREYKTNGINCYLNGQPFMLRGSSMMYWKQTGAEVADLYSSTRQQTGSNAFREHLMTTPSSVLDYCDETGLAILQQDTLFYGASYMTNPDFWPNTKTAWYEYVKANRNHPSVLIWSVDNEAAFMSGEYNPGSPAVPHLIEMHDQTKVIDPTRPVTASHEHNLNERSDFYDDVMGFGYEYYNLLPDYIREYRTYRIPIEDPVVRDMARPLMNDEWLDYRSLHGAASIVGDLAYVVADYSDLRPIWGKYAKGYSGYMGMAEQRRLSGLACGIVLGDHTTYNELPDGPMYSSATEMKAFLHKNFQELVVVPVGWHAGQNADQAFAKDFIVMNDHSYALPVTLSWELKYRGGATIYTGSMQLSMSAFEHRQVQITATLPAVVDTVQTDLIVRLLDQPGGTELYSDTLPYTLTKKPSFSTVPTFLLMGADQYYQDLLTILGLSFVTSGPPPGKLIMVAPGASLGSSDWASLENYAKNGKSVLIFTTNLPASFCGVPLSITTLKTNTVHINATDHAIFGSLQPHDLRFWAPGPDYRLAENCLLRPAYGSFTTLLDTSFSHYMWSNSPTLAGKYGMNFAPMIEINPGTGTGRTIITQLPLIDKSIYAEAITALIFRRTLDYLDSDAAPALPVISEGVTLPSSIGLEKTTWANLSPTTTSAVLLEGSAADFSTVFNAHSAALDTYVRAGGDLYIHNLTSANCSVVNAVWPLELAGTANSAKRLLLLPTDTNTKNWMWYQSGTTWPLYVLPQPVYDPLLSGISHYQTCWYEDGGLDPVKSQASILATALSGNGSVSALTYPAALLVSNLGSGRIIFDQVVWDSSLPSTYLTSRATEYIDQLLVNLGAEFDITPPVAGTCTPPASVTTSTISVPYSGASDSGSGLKQVELWYKKETGGTWTNSGLTKTAGADTFTFTPSSGSGRYYFDLVAEDNAGNRSASASGDGDGVTIFKLWWSDGFESGNFTAGGWTNSGCNITSNYKYSGTYSAVFNYTDSLTKLYSTVGKSDIKVEYARYTRTMEADDHFISEWSPNGSTWYTLEDQTGNSAWTVKLYQLPSGADNQSGFRIRFRTSHNGSLDYAYLDDVKIIGL